MWNGKVMPDLVHRSINPYPAASEDLGRWLWAMEDARERTKLLVEGVTPEELDWTTPGVDNSIGAILYHVALIEFDYLCCDILKIEPYFADLMELFPWDHRDEAGHLATARSLTLTNHLTTLDAVRTRFLESLAPFSRIELSTSREFPEWEYDITPEWTLHHLMQHESEHRGEIGAIRTLYKALK
jgi:uncharacterized damage-inducible protein DinB